MASPRGWAVSAPSSSTACSTVSSGVRARSTCTAPIPAADEPSLREFALAIHPEDRTRWIETHRRALKTGGEARVEYRYLRHGRDTAWIRSIARAEAGAGGRIERLAGVAQDVTGIRAMQQQLASSEAKFRDLTNMSSDWIWETDAQHQWSYFSGSAASVLGGWVKSLIGRRLWELPGSQFAFEQPDWQGQRTLMDSQAPFESFEYAVIDPEGNAHFVAISGRAVFDAGGTFIGYRGVGRNITREKQQRLLLRIESDIATIMREQNDPERVITGILVTLCTLMGCIGGASLVAAPRRHGFKVQERWGIPTSRR